VRLLDLQTGEKKNFIPIDCFRLAQRGAPLNNFQMEGIVAQFFFAATSETENVRLVMKRPVRYHRCGEDVIAMRERCKMEKERKNERKKNSDAKLRPPKKKNPKTNSQRFI
jgi:hypothetical protein